MKIRAISLNSNSCSKRNICQGNVTASVVQTKKTSTLKKNLTIGAACAAAAALCFLLLKPKNRLDYKYIKNLAKDLSKDLGIEIKPEMLDCVMGKKELLKILPKFKAENYNNKNFSDYIYKIDLHSHSNHSDGYAQIAKMLNEAAEYANKMHKKNNEKFIFSLTDHDNVDGVKEILKLIVKEPQKYKNIKFVPGVELSMCFLSGNNIKSGEVLLHGINPYSKEIKSLVYDLRDNRNNMFKKSMEKLGREFNINEMYDYFIRRDDNEIFAYNLHYRIKNYAQIKNRVIKISIEQNKNPKSLYKKLMDDFVFASNKNNRKILKPDVNPENFDKYLKSINISTKTEVTDKKIDEICEEFFPKIINKKIISNTENSFEKIIATIKKDKDVCLGFAHPYYTSKTMENYNDDFLKLIKYAGKKLKTTESYHTCYNPEILQEAREVNIWIESQGLKAIGGNDNHKYCFIPEGS